MILIKKKINFLFSLFIIFFLSACSFSIDSSLESDNSTRNETEKVEEEKDDIVNKSEENKNELSFYAVGDNLIHKEIIDYAEINESHYDFTPIYQNLKKDIKNADLSFINQESIIGGDDLGFTGYPSFNTPSDMAGNLADLGFDIVTASNNHSLDRGTEGIENTLKYWEEYEDDLLFTGVFNSQKERDEIPTIEVDDLSFAVLSYTYGTNGIEAEHPYLLNYFDKDLITEDVKKAEDMSDFIIVSAHWGDEHSLSPNEMQKDYAQLFADLEVDLVVGTHSHTIQPIEWVKGENGNETLVIYSLGNFLASTTSDINLLGGSLNLDFIQENDEYSIGNVVFEPLVIHYETEIENNIDSRTDFKIYKLENYTKEKSNNHALNNYEDNQIDPEKYHEIVEDVIDQEFLN